MKGCGVDVRRGVIVAVLVFILVAGGGILYLTRGLSEMQALVIEDRDASGLPGGLYAGAFRGYRWSNSVEIAVEGGEIAAIEVVDPHIFYREEVADEIIDRVLSEQTTAVDAVAGATVSSNAILKAIEDGLRDGR